MWFIFFIVRFRLLFWSQDIIEVIYHCILSDGTQSGFSNEKFLFSHLVISILWDKLWDCISMPLLFRLSVYITIGLGKYGL